MFPFSQKWSPTSTSTNPSYYRASSNPLPRLWNIGSITFYVERTKTFRKSNKLFLCFQGPNNGAPTSSQSIARWIVQTISLAYNLSGKSPPEHLTAHSTRALSTSAAFQRGTEVPDICRATTWSTLSTFVKHYRLDVRARQDAAFGRAVLSSFLP